MSMLRLTLESTAELMMLLCIFYRIDSLDADRQDWGEMTVPT